MKKDNMQIFKVDLSIFKKEIYRRYKKMFPRLERRSIKKFKVLERKGVANFLVIKVDNKICGFMTVNIVKDIDYIILDYFGIFPEYQNRGLGSHAIELLKEYFPTYTGIIIEVEKSEYSKNAKEFAIRERRIKFYERLNFVPLKYEFDLYTVKYTPYILYVNPKDDSEDIIVKKIFEIYKVTSSAKKEDFGKYHSYQRLY